MLAQLLQFALARPLVIVIAWVVISVAGAWAFLQLKLEAYPDISDTNVVVISMFPGFAAQQVEQQVTVPIERALNNTPHVIARRSRTIFGLSLVELTFADGTDDYFARQLVLERLRDVELPEGVTSSLGPLSTGISEFYRYTLEGDGYDAMSLREIQDWIVVPRLFQVEGVADVVTFGGLVRQYQIEIEPRALDKYKLGIRQIADAVKNNNRNAGGALLEMGQQSMAIRSSGLIRSVEDIENIILDGQNGVPVFVRDVGRVKLGALPQTGIFELNRQRSDFGSVEGIVLMRRGENPSEVLARIRAAVDEITAKRLPQGVRITAFHDRTELVQNTLHTVSRVLLEGFVIVVVTLFLILLNLRAALLAALIIPLSLLFAFLCMHLTGVSLSLLSVGALDFGIIVDGTIVMVERIIRRIREPQAEAGSTAIIERIRSAVLEVQRPLLFALCILIAAYLPLLTLERVERRLFTPMALTVCYALLGSLLMTFTLVPALARYLFGERTVIKRNRLLESLGARYGRLLHSTLRRAGWTTVIAAAVVIGALYLGTRLGTEFLPQLDEGVIWIRSNLPPGISLSKSAETAARMRALILQSSEVSTVMSQTGRNDTGTDPFGPNRVEILIDLHPYSTWASGKSKIDLVQEISRRLRAEIPAATFNFTQPIIDTSTEIATGSSADLAVIISGPDLKQLRALAQQALTLLQSLSGAADASIEQETDQAQLLIAINRFQIARYGINVSDVQDMIDLALGGSPISTLFEGERRFDVVARLTSEARADPSAIGDLLVPTPHGGRIPLSQLAGIQIVDGPTIILHRDNERAITVRTNIRHRDQGSFVAEAQARFADVVKLPGGYHVTWGGQFENLNRAQRHLTTIIPATIALIFALLFLTFGSARDAFIVLLNVPFSLAGGLIALYFRGIPLTVSAAVGFIALFGVAVMGGVLYITTINRWRGNPHISLSGAVIMAAQTQFRPWLVLILVAMLGMLPAALATGIGSDIQRPLATVVVGGLASTLLLTLLALPAVYLLAARVGRPWDGWQR